MSVSANTIRNTLPLLYQLACRMALAEKDRIAIVQQGYAQALSNGSTVAASDDSLMSALLQSAAEVAQKQQRQRPQLAFEELDALIREDPTNPDALRSLTDGDQQNLLWELKQSCLTAAVTCLPPGERVAFVLLELLGLGADEAAKILDIKASALRVRASRGRNKIVDYLSPRCGHVNGRNPCRCPNRLGVALRKGFVGPVAGRRVSLREPFGAQGPQHEPLTLYRSLPLLEPPPELLDELIAAYAS